MVEAEDDIEFLPEVEGNDQFAIWKAYLGECSPAERRRYLALDMARLCGSAPEKLVERGAEISRFLESGEGSAKLKVVK